MIKLVGSLLAFTALAVSILTGADPFTCLTRSAAAFAVGAFAASLWSGIVSTVQAPKKASSNGESAAEPIADSKDTEGQKAA
jgi:hypothetical protein